MSRPDSQQRIVLTGAGLLTPLGRTVEEVWSRWSTAETVFGPVARFDGTNLPTRIAAEIRGFVPRKELKNGRLVRLLRPGEDFGYLAAGMAVHNAGLAEQGLEPERSGIAIGCRKEGPRVENLFPAIKASLNDQGEMDHARFVEEGIKLIPPQTIVEGLPNGCMYYIAHEFLLQGVNYNFLCLGSGATMALGESMRAIRRHEADLMLAGGYDSWVNWVYLAQLSNQRLLSRRNDDPQHAHRPFSRDRDGSVAGEGAGLMVLERLEAARKRGARMIGELYGYAAATGTRHDDEPACARVLADCIRRALVDANCAPAEIDFVHMTGDATPAGDRIESQAVRAVLGERTGSVPVTTLKSATGHLGNASGAVELAVMLECMRRRVLLPIVNLTDPDPELGLDFVTTVREGVSLKTGLMLSRGWPSHYTALVIGAPPGG